MKIIKRLIGMILIIPAVCIAAIVSFLAIPFIGNDKSYLILYCIANPIFELLD